LTIELLVRVTTSNGCSGPKRGSGDSAGLLEELTVEGRQRTTDGFI